MILGSLFVCSLLAGCVHEKSVRIGLVNDASTISMRGA
jgi:hypothetical protein